MRNRVIGAVAQAGFPVSLSLAPFCDGSLWLSVQGMFPGYCVPRSRGIVSMVTFQHHNAQNAP
ncbi:TPA: hypothetical protein U2R10_001948 [Proteus mirabilis]|uniref:hypothetical protein n=1 Tax=Proteus mirabilis TaxID=584 RepID=UPI000C057E0A|nr:hypothetical protein [Proteus mirabilis]AVL26853.1 hypothetical protein CEQ26_29320 [Escherichia coli O104:H4]EAA0704249.1 hypothetical protein [Shigella boydii]EAA1351215.1 hypothetical protein [Escherichia coli]EBR0130064.1 hypothetical protein [Salmonella enterica subsp. enterica serovar Ajiobo]EFN6706691.1 hypothetical protein [Escherichia coli O20:H9]EFX7210790.1 hypothetical protein [Shigella sonnei]EGA7129128.1 hypothetical protein [Shigella flexneri]PNY43624.1 hypothetical protei